MENFAQTKVSDIVTRNYLTAMIFSKYGIDFCCNGKRTIARACKDDAALIDSLEAEIKQFFATQAQTTQVVDYASWSLEALLEYVVDKHHSYIRDHIPLIQGYLHKLCRVHGKNHPELFEIDQLFTASSDDLLAHLQKEEQILFAYIFEIVAASNNNTQLRRPPFITIKNPVAMMMNEHITEGERFLRIRELSNNFTAPADGCNTYKAAYAALADYERDLHLHIHLENNLIFERAIAVEEELFNSPTKQAEQS